MASELVHNMCYLRLQTIMTLQQVLQVREQRIFERPISASCLTPATIL